MRKQLIFGVFAAGLMAAAPLALAQQQSISAMSADGIVKALKSQGRVSMSGALFQTDSAKLTDASGAVLGKLASSLKQLPEARLAVVGHTDISGDFAYNVDLSKRRAKAVIDALVVNHSIKNTRLVALGAGPIDPTASNATVDGRAQNRRVSFVLISKAQAAPAANEKPTPGYNNKIPPSILTPDKLETRLGTLHFFDGIPTKESAQRLYNNLDYVRGFETFMNGMPAASLEAIRRGHLELGATRSNQVLIFDELMDSNPLFLTGNTDTVYLSAILDLKRDGPTVIEIPPGTGPGTVNDAFFRFVVDTGPPGPDRGKGAKYLILPPGYEAKDIDGYVAKGYVIAKSPTWINWFIARGFLKDGKPDFSSKLFRNGVKIYPLARAVNPPAMEFIDGSTKAFNTIHSTDFNFYEELHAVIDREPIEFIEPQLRGVFASVGIQKGKPFAPDARMKDILTKAATVANYTARAMLWYERDQSAFLYKNSYWKRGFVGGSYQFLKEQGLGGRNLDARSQFFYFATVNTPAMTWKLIGKGSQYGWGYLDKDGNYLDGSKTYKLNLPKDAPAKKFMSVVVYDPQTRSQLQTDQPFPSKNNKRDKMITNDDGSIDLYFGPKAPKGKEANWIQTVPKKGWFSVLRLYSPTEAWFDKTWRPGEIELVK